MNFHKAIYRSEALLESYQENSNEVILSGFKKTSHNIKSKAYLLNIKYLYVYQALKAHQQLPKWYCNLAEQKLDELELYFNTALDHLLNDHHFMTDEMNQFLNQRIEWVYKGKFRVYPVTPLDYLPLKLRLKVYVYLYREEEDAKAKCHLRNRVSVTLAKLGHLELANFYSVYNWLMAQEVMNTHFAKANNLKHSLNNHKYASQSVKKLLQDQKDVSEVTEICFYYTQLLNKDNLNYDRANTATIDLMELYYSQYPQLQQLNLPLKTYLRTKDTKEFYEAVAVRRMKFIRDVAHLPYNLKETTLSPVNQDQLGIYNYLLRISQ